jgi:hypothetical protein
MMSAALARLVPDPLVYLRDEPAPDAIGLGTAVRISPFGGRSKAGMTEEGVVIELVWRGEPVRTAGILYASRLKGSRSSVTRYVVQCANYRVVRRATELVVVAL